MHLPPPPCWSSMLPLRMLGLLMLLLAQCGAEDACTSDLNPLTLDPPVIIQEYGSQAFLNCTSNSDSFEEMSLWIGNQSFPKELGRDLSHHWALEDWDVNAECRIKLNESLECTKKAEITVYQKPELNISMKSVNVSAEETEYTIQCDVINVAPVQHLTITWYKNDEVIQNSSFSEVTKVPVNESSVLRVNVSKVENVVALRCEARLNLGTQGPQFPVTSLTHNVSALYAPQAYANKSGYITVSKGINITLTCDVEGNPPPGFKWTVDGLNMSEDTNKLHIRQVDHDATYTCMATNYLGDAILTFHVQVADETTEVTSVTTPNPEKEKDCPLTLTPYEVVVRFGDPFVINCSTSATDFTIIGWEAPTGGISSQLSSNVVWRVERVEDWTLSAFCYVTLRSEQCQVHPSITFYKTPDVVSVSAVNLGPMIEGIEYKLRCDVISVAPVKDLRVKWYHGNENVFTDSSRNISASSAFPTNELSILTFTPKKSDNGSVFRCEADLQLKPKEPEFLRPTSSPPYIAVVHYKPLFKSCPDRFSGTEHTFSMNQLHCETDGNPPPTVEWYYQGKPINASAPLSRTHTGKYTVVVTNSIGKNETSVFITVEYGPSFNCEGLYEVQVNAEHKIPCEPEGLPPPNITWFKNGKMLASPHHWTQQDSGNYSLRATNKHGTVEHPFYLDVLYAPRFKEGNTNVEVMPGENKTLECSAEGNPEPEVQWLYTPAKNLKETTMGRQRIITVTGATSTNAGSYNCVATNKVGSVTRSVLLVEKSIKQQRSYIMFLLLLVPLILIVSILVFFVCKRKNKQGYYDFVSNQDIPMTYVM